MTTKSDEADDHKEPAIPARGLDSLLGLEILRASGEEVVASLKITRAHHQPMGIVHGGVYCSMVETACSFGAQLYAASSGRYVVGVDNHTSFLKATRAGVLSCTARPLSQGRRTQLWEAHILNEAGETAATGRVRLLCLEPGNLAGKPLSVGSASGD